MGACSPEEAPLGRLAKNASESCAAAAAVVVEQSERQHVYAVMRPLHSGHTMITAKHRHSRSKAHSVGAACNWTIPAAIFWHAAHLVL